MVLAGYILMVFGVLTLYFTISSLGLCLIGAMIAFSSTGTLVEIEKKQYKSYLLLAGVLQIGKAQTFAKKDRIEVKKFKGKNTPLRWFNRQSASEINDYRIYLITNRAKKKILLARVEKEEEAMRERELLQAVISG